MRGKGKTNYVKSKILGNSGTNVSPIIPCYIIDIRNEFKHIPGFTNITYFTNWLYKRDTRYLKLPQTNEFYKYGQFRFVFNNSKEWEQLYKLLSNFRNCTIVVDEADAIFTVRKFERPLIDVFLGSRNNNVSMIFIGKRPFLIPIFIRSQTDTFTVFCVEEENDINYLSKRVKQDFPKDVFKLERGEAIVFKSGEKPMVQIYDKFIGE
jgi:hypothetical protein